MAPGDRPSSDDEQARYRQHQNDPSDQRYRDFLGRLIAVLRPFLSHNSRGLDYGCGPTTAMATILTDEGFSVDSYDPFFFPDQQLLDESYDFITCSEAAEHFFRPAEEFRRLHQLLRPGGHLGLMTQFIPTTSSFDEWYYPRDNTHVTFYRPETMQTIAKQFDFSVRALQPNIVVFERQ